MLLLDTIFNVWRGETDKKRDKAPPHMKANNELKNVHVY